MASYTINEEKSYAQEKTAVFQAALGAVEGLEGKVLQEDNGRLHAQFDKKIHGQVLGDRTQMEVSVSDASSGGSRVTIEAYPIDPVGRKLQFGARKGVARKVLDWYWAHLEHRLPE